MQMNVGCSLPFPGARLPAPPGTLRPDVRWGPKGGSARKLSQGRGWGRGHGFRGVVAAASVLGGITSVTAGRTLGVMDQDMHRSEAWLGNSWRLAGVIRAAIAGLLPKAHHCGRGWGEHLILLGHGVAPGGAWYNNCLLKGSVAVVVGGGCGCGGGMSRYYYLDKNDNFACHATFAG